MRREEKGCRVLRFYPSTCPAASRVFMREATGGMSYSLSSKYMLRPWLKAFRNVSLSRCRVIVPHWNSSGAMWQALLSLDERLSYRYACGCGEPRLVLRH